MTRTGHQWARCTRCARRIWTANPGRRCAITPGCTGTHGTRTTTKKAGTK